MAPGDAIESGALTIEPVHTPGHTAGMLSLLVNGTDVFTGDTLFKGSVGGVHAPGSSGYADIKSSIMDKLLRLPAQTRIHPGHTAGMLSLLVGGTDVFTGDTLFKGSVGGVHAPGSTGFADIKSSILDKLLKLPGETRIHPGHTDPTTVADELEHNGFVRIWRGVDAEGNEPCTALGRPATLILFAPDYDGGHKAWVRWPDGSDDIVPGSRVERGG